MGKVFLNDLPRYGNTNKIDWNKSVGYSVPFVCYGINGIMKILSYNSENGELKIGYDDKIDTIKYSVFKNGNVGKIIGRYDFKYNIGEIITSSNGDRRKILGRYKDFQNGNRKTYKCECLECKAIYDIRETILDNKYGCGVCSNQICVEGINDIYSQNPEYVKYFEVPENAKKVTIGSCKKVKLRCPICGYKKELTPEILKKVGFNCNKCNDGISYPNKIMSNLLKVLNVSYEAEYSPDWAFGRRYDFLLYINNNKYIVEMHGAQHYYGGFERIGGRNLNEEVRNDAYKKKLALKNGFNKNNYIVIDCRESNINFIKDNIYRSPLHNILTLYNVDWIKIDKLSQKSLVFEVCDYWQKYKSSTEELSKVFKIAQNTVSRYLKKGAELNLCDYTPKEARQIAMTQKVGRTLVLKKEDEVLNRFNSCADLERKSIMLYGVKLYAAQISKHAIHGGLYKGYSFEYIN